VTIGDMFGIDEWADQRRRHDRVRDPQARKQNLVEAADIDDAAVAVHALQGGDGSALVAIVAIVVVFDDVRVSL
jgi:hypothetical protein